MEVFKRGKENEALRKHCKEHRATRPPEVSNAMQLFPHVKSVTDHYRKKLEKDDLKRLAKEV